MRKVLGLLALSLLVVGTVIPAFADASVTVMGEASPMIQNEPDIHFGDAQLTGSTLEVEDIDNERWEVRDATGLAAGWYVTLDVGEFVNEDESGATIPLVYEGKDLLKMKLSQDTVADITDDQSSSALPQVGAAWADDFAPLGASQTILVARSAEELEDPYAEGMGQYGFQPDFKLTVPATTKAGTYVSETTLTIVAGNNP